MLNLVYHDIQVIMNNNRKYLATLLLFHLSFAISVKAQLPVKIENGTIQIESKNTNYSFTPTFTVLYNATDPDMMMKPVNIKAVSYNVLTWKVKDSSKADFIQKTIGKETAGDGFDDRILRKAAEKRTGAIHNVGEPTNIRANRIRQAGDTTFFEFPASSTFIFKAYVLTKAKPYPILQYELQPLVQGYFSVGYTGAPSFTEDKAAGIWQPLIWQEKRIPENAFLTPTFMATLPTTMVFDGKNTIGVMASPDAIPFQPLPVLANSQFGISLINAQKHIQPSVYAPIPGGYKSKMKVGEPFRFALHLMVEPQTINRTYESIARKMFGFKDYRSNAISTLNKTLDNIVDYSLSEYTWYVDSLKGYAYATDVPGAVKNVSSLNPLELAIVRDDVKMFEKRAYPQIEYMLSREKFLFSLDSTQKIQSPSRKLKGPVAPMSELGALYTVLGKQNPFLLQSMKKEYANARTRNLDVEEKGNSWINAMHLFRTTGDSSYLKTAIAKAAVYLQTRVNKAQSDFNDPFAGGFFFWPAYTNRWIELLQLYEITKERSFLDAAVEGARNYTQFIWMVPAIPDSLVTVNKDGKAPYYWYLKAKGHKQMYYPEEKVPAWRLSEIGHTPESSGTSTGHRGIFMANFAPWMLRLGYYAKDSFLLNVAKAAVIGRYRSFPGYHINTERTTAYENVDFPFHKHLDQSVNSFHYNHILPMASMLLDYLVSDAFIRSKGAIDFPAEYIEGYAYLQSKMYGARAGKFYSANNVKLWMPGNLIKTDNVELNYVSARKQDTLFIAFTNQSKQNIKSVFTLNDSLAKLTSRVSMDIWKNNKWTRIPQVDKQLSVQVDANGITAIRLSGVEMPNGFQQKILGEQISKTSDFIHLPQGNANAMLLHLGNYDKRLYVYLEDDDNKVKSATLQYRIADGKTFTLEDNQYPFEFTVPLQNQSNIQFSLTLNKTNGEKDESKIITLGQQ